MQIQRLFTGAPWEKKVGYCRALKTGNQIFVTGTASVDTTGKVFKPGDAYAQTQKCLKIIESSLKELGAGLNHVVRTRMFVTDISLWEQYGRAHQECFGENPPTTTMVEVKRLIHPDMLIEIEADAMMTQQP